MISPYWAANEVIKFWIPPQGRNLTQILPAEELSAW